MIHGHPTFSLAVYSFAALAALNALTLLGNAVGWL